MAEWTRAGKPGLQRLSEVDLVLLLTDRRSQLKLRAARLKLGRMLDKVFAAQNRLYNGFC